MMFGVNTTSAKSPIYKKGLSIAQAHIIHAVTIYLFYRIAYKHSK